MSERFKYYFPSQIIKDNKTGQRYYGNKPLVELLNELHEENQALKSDRVRYEEECRLDVFKELYEENEQLKLGIVRLKSYLIKTIPIYTEDVIEEIINGQYPKW